MPNFGPEAGRKMESEEDWLLETTCIVNHSSSHIAHRSHLPPSRRTLSPRVKSDSVYMLGQSQNGSGTTQKIIRPIIFYFKTERHHQSLAFLLNLLFDFSSDLAYHKRLFRMNVSKLDYDNQDFILFFVR